jgi:putative ABC transport system ATP-binding protein
VLVLENVWKSFRRPGAEPIEVLSGASLVVPPSTAIGILGRSGSGKSTLLSIIGLLEAPDDGTLELDGIDVRPLSDNAAARLRGERLGFVFQRALLLPSLSAAENVELPLLHAEHVPFGRTRRRLVSEALERVGISHRAKHRPHQLSGGEQQLVALARALVRNPTYLLADEPTGNLDPTTGERIVRTLVAMTSAPPTSVVMVTHDHQLASLLHKRYALVDGRLGEMA